MSDTESRKAFEEVMSANGQNITKPGSDFYEYQSAFTERLWDMISARDAEITELSRRLRTAQELHDSDIVVIGQIHARNEALKARVEELEGLHIDACTEWAKDVDRLAAHEKVCAGVRVKVTERLPAVRGYYPVLVNSETTEEVYFNPEFGEWRQAFVTHWLDVKLPGEKR